MYMRRYMTFSCKEHPMIVHVIVGSFFQQTFHDSLDPEMMCASRADRRVRLISPRIVLEMKYGSCPWFYALLRVT